MKVETRGESCTVAGHTTFQNDVILGDGNGVVAISADCFDAVVQKSCEIMDIEDSVMSRVKGGANLFDLVTTGGHI